MNRNCLSYWFPKLQDAGVSVPRTEIIRTNIKLECLCDGEIPEGFDDFRRSLEEAAVKIAPLDSPLFLRTGQGSGKHDWKNCCYLTAASKLADHVRSLVEWSHMVDFIGLPHDVWCVREYLPVEPVAVLPRYGDMPLVRELRGFIENGKVVCVHNYWPAKAIVQGGGTEEEAKRATVFINAVGCTEPAAIDLIHEVAAAFADNGSWSVDVLQTKRGWFVTDMAEAGRSFHWEGCENESRVWAKPKGGGQ